LFSSSAKMFECLIMVASIDFSFICHDESDDPAQLPKKRSFLTEYLNLDPEGAGGPWHQESARYAGHLYSARAGPPSRTMSSRCAAAVRRRFGAAGARCSIPPTSSGRRPRRTDFWRHRTDRRSSIASGGWPGLSLRSPGFKAFTRASKTQPRSPSRLESSHV
jgi:hypothetical protein